MAALRRLVAVYVLSLCVVPAACAVDKKEDVFKDVKLGELIAAIKAEKGKVVVVDFWADT
jgi:hypothetical protein